MKSLVDEVSTINVLILLSLIQNLYVGENFHCVNILLTHNSYRIFISK
jgi:hypothetical protein